MISFKQYYTALLYVFLGMLLTLTLLTVTRAQSNTVDYLPILASQQPNAPATLVKLVDGDTTFVSAAAIPNTCRVIVTYVARGEGNLVHVAEDIGTQLEEVPMPRIVAQFQATQPDFVVPGEKHASGFTVFVCNRMRVYFNGRSIPQGPFELWRLDMPIP